MPDLARLDVSDLGHLVVRPRIGQTSDPAKSWENTKKRRPLTGSHYIKPGFQTLTRLLEKRQVACTKHVGVHSCSLMLDHVETVHHGCCYSDHTATQLEALSFSISIFSLYMSIARHTTKKCTIKKSGSSTARYLSDATVTLRTVVTFVTWNRVSSLESVL